MLAVARVPDIEVKADPLGVARAFRQLWRGHLPVHLPPVRIMSLQAAGFVEGREPDATSTPGGTPALPLLLHFYVADPVGRSLRVPT